MKVAWALCVFMIVGVVCTLGRYFWRESVPAASEIRRELSSIEIRVALGYKDARPARFVGDRNERMYLLDLFMKPCRDGEFACGFLRDEEDADLLSKTLVRADGNIRRINLRLTHSSVGPDDVTNRGDGFQKWQSEVSQRNFKEGLQKSDVVLYLGHSRDGGGPAFVPPRLKKNLHVDYNHYQRTKPGMNLMLEALSQTQTPPKVIGLLSCYSERHFVKAVKQAAPSVRFVSNDKLLYYTEALDETDAVIGRYLRDAANEKETPGRSLAYKPGVQRTASRN